MNVTIRKGSWHYVLATRISDWEPIKEYGYYTFEEDGITQVRDGNGDFVVHGTVYNDFCSYLSAVLWGCSGLLLVGLRPSV